MIHPFVPLVADRFIDTPRPVPPTLLIEGKGIDSRLTDDPRTWSALITRVLNKHVDPRLLDGDSPSNNNGVFKGLPSNLVPGKAGGVPVSWNTESRVRQVLADRATVHPEALETNSLPLSQVKDPTYKLRTGQVVQAFELYLEYVSAGRVLAGATTASKATAKKALLELVALEAFLVRLSAAIYAASNAGTSLAEALALYRVEGNLVAPMSAGHMADALPVNDSMEVNAEGVLPNLSRNLSVEVSFTMRRALWSYTFKGLAERDLKNVLPEGALRLPNVGAEREKAEGRIKCRALVTWMLVLGGLDSIVRNTFSQVPESFGYHLTAFIHQCRTSLDLPSDVNKQRDVFDRLFSDLQCTWPTDIDGRVVVAPANPVALASYVLTIALLVLRRDYAHGGGPSIQPFQDLQYVVYNLQSQRVGKEDDRFGYLLASAAVAAARVGSPAKVNPKFRPLAERLKDPGAKLDLPRRLTKDPAKDPSDHVLIFEKLTAPDGFLSDVTSAGLLADFILRAESADWSGYTSPRGNLARYRKLLGFYSALLK